MAETENTAQETPVKEETMYDRIREQNNPTETPVVTNEIPPAESAEKKDEVTPQTEEPSNPKEEKVFDVSDINKHFGTSFEDESSLKNIFESQDKFKDFDSQLKSKEDALTSAQERYNALLDSIDPEKVLPNKEAVALSQLSEKYPNADLGTLSFIRKTELGQLDKLDALLMIDKLNVPSNVSDSIREAEILRSLGIEETEKTELTDNDKYRIEREFTKQANLLTEIKDFQPEISKFDFEAERSTRQQTMEAEKKSLKSHNEQALKIILNDFKETKSSYKDNDKEHAFSFVVDDDFRQNHFNDILDRVTDSGIKITKDNANEIATDIDNLYWLQNRHKITSDIVKQALSKEKEQVHKEIHSDSPTNKIEAPTNAPTVPKTMMEQYRAGKVKTR